MIAREELRERILMTLISKNVDVSNVKDDIQIILADYEVQERSTEVALRSADRNEFLMKKFITAKLVAGCTERTIKYYGKTLAFALERIGKTVDDIEADDIRLYLAKRQKVDGITRTTAGNELRVISSFFTYLCTEEVLQRNPVLKIESIKPDTKKEKAFTDMEVEKIRDCLKSAREKAVVEVLLSTGCRVTELVLMKIEELRDGAIVVHGKGEKDRTCYMNARATIALENYLKERNDKNPYIFCGGVQGMSFKYCRRDSEWYKRPEMVGEGHMDKSSVEQMMRRIGNRSGVEHVHPHRFRKTCATMALKRGMPIEKVSKMLGHEQLETTKIYISISEDEMEQAHRKYVV